MFSRRGLCRIFIIIVFKVYERAPIVFIVVVYRSVLGLLGCHGTLLLHAWLGVWSPAVTAVSWRGWNAENIHVQRLIWWEFQIARNYIETLLYMLSCNHSVSLGLKTLPFPRATLKLSFNYALTLALSQLLFPAFAPTFMTCAIQSFSTLKFSLIGRCPSWWL